MKKVTSAKDIDTARLARALTDDMKMTTAKDIMFSKEQMDFLRLLMRGLGIEAEMALDRTIVDFKLMGKAIERDGDLWAVREKETPEQARKRLVRLGIIDG